MLGAEVSFHEGPKCLDEGPKCLFQKRPKCPIGAEVVGAEVVGAEVSKIRFNHTITRYVFRLGGKLNILTALYLKSCDLENARFAISLHDNLNSFLNVAL